MRKMIFLSLPLLTGLAFQAIAKTPVPQLTGFHDFFTVSISPEILPFIRYVGQDGDIYNDSDYGFACNPAAGVCNFAVNDKSILWSKGHVTYQIGDNANNKPYCFITIYDGSYVNTPEISKAMCGNGAYVTKLTGTTDHHYIFAIKR